VSEKAKLTVRFQIVGASEHDASRDVCVELPEERLGMFIDRLREEAMHQGRRYGHWQDGDRWMTDELRKQAIEMLCSLDDEDNDSYINDYTYDSDASLLNELRSQLEAYEGDEETFHELSDMIAKIVSSEITK
jgi:hypothetical protein